MISNFHSSYSDKPCCVKATGFSFFLLLILPFLALQANTKQNNLTLLKEMFEEAVVKKNASLIPKYYDSEFELYSNGETWDYSKYLAFHEEIYATPIQYSVELDSKTLFEQGDRVAARVYITTAMPGESPKKIEVILIAQYRNRKIYRIWELTYPDWSKLSEFSSLPFLHRNRLLE